MIIVSGLLVMLAGFIIPQKPSSNWFVNAHHDAVIHSEKSGNSFQLTVVDGRATVYELTRQTGTLTNDQGYIEKIWIESVLDSGRLNLSGAEQVYYEKQCRCIHAGNHLVDTGTILFSEGSIKSGSLFITFGDGEKLELMLRNLKQQ